MNDKTIFLLHRNNLLIPLITTELKKQELSNITVSKELKISALQQFFKQLKLPNQEAFDQWKKK